MSESKALVCECGCATFRVEFDGGSNAVCTDCGSVLTIDRIIAGRRDWLRSASDV